MTSETGCNAGAHSTGVLPVTGERGEVTGCLSSSKDVMQQLIPVSLLVGRVGRLELRLATGTVLAGMEEAVP